MLKILTYLKNFLSVFVFIKSIFRKETIQTASEKAEEATEEKPVAKRARKTTKK